VRTFRACLLLPLVLGLAVAGATQKAGSRPARPAAPPPPSGPPLQVGNPIVSQFEDGSPLEGGQKLVVGEFAFFRFNVLNFRTSDDGVVKITGRVQVFDSRGTPIAPVDEVAIATSIREEDKDWKPRIHTQFQLPGIAPPGTYKVHFEATDEQTHQKAAGDAAFEVDGHDVPASPTLAIRSIGFYRQAEDEVALGVAAYRPADTVWVKFDATGYKYGEQNAIDVTYDVAVTGPDGKQVFSQPDAAGEKSQAAYPQPWVPGTFSLTLTPDTSKGTYTLSITARDAVGKQTTTEKADFKVE
jgi:hypothetical protein